MFTHTCIEVSREFDLHKFIHPTLTWSPPPPAQYVQPRHAQICNKYSKTHTHTSLGASPFTRKDTLRIMHGLVLHAPQVPWGVKTTCRLCWLVVLTTRYRGYELTLFIFGWRLLSWPTFADNAEQVHDAKCTIPFLSCEGAGHPDCTHTNTLLCCLSCSF